MKMVPIVPLAMGKIFKHGAWLVTLVNGGTLLRERLGHRTGQGEETLKSFKAELINIKHL